MIDNNKQFENVASQDKLIWLDLEMTGLDPLQNVIIEAAVVITDSDLNIVDQSSSYAIFQPEEELKKMDNWNLTTHTKSGLLEKVKSSKYYVEDVENEILTLIKQHVGQHKSPLCGNTVHQDRKFLARYMPRLENYLHYRNLDVSTIKELAKRWHPDIYNGFKKHNKHEALADILESINELKYYREKIFIS
ncbi:MAG: oligoribonuclease [Neisseriaceae bacterium]